MDKHQQEAEKKKAAQRKRGDVRKEVLKELKKDAVKIAASVASVCQGNSK
jgi:hypothetical protein